MRSTKLHLKVIISILILLGLSIIGYQVFVLKTPLTQTEVDHLWTIDAKIDFDVKSKGPVNVEFHIPSSNGDYAVSDELFLASGYGQNVTDQKYNRLVTWSARSVSGHKTIFYRLNLTKRFADKPQERVKEELWRNPIEVGEPESGAVERIVSEIRNKSVDISSFITTTINLLNDSGNSDVKLLLGGEASLEKRFDVIELILSHAHIPIQRVHTLELSQTTNQTPSLWIRSYIEPSGSLDRQNTLVGEGRGSWYYFDPLTGDTGLPENHFVWWVGSMPVIDISNAKNVNVRFSLEQNELTAIELAKLATGMHLSEYSFYTLPIMTQSVYQSMLMIPFGVLVILVLRNIVGINTLGTFTPVLIAMAFRETGLVFGIIFFTVIVFFGLLLRSYLEHLKLQMLPRLSVVLTFVVLLIVFFGLFSHKLGLEQGLSLSLFPMVILTMTIERLSITWDERGSNHALKIAFGTLVIASLAYGVMGYAPLAYFVFTFPAVLLLVLAFMLAMGDYRGYRLLELRRFKAMIQE